MAYVVAENFRVHTVAPVMSVTTICQSPAFQNLPSKSFKASARERGRAAGRE